MFKIIVSAEGQIFTNISHTSSCFLKQLKDKFNKCMIMINFVCIMNANE